MSKVLSILLATALFFIGGSSFIKAENNDFLIPDIFIKMYYASNYEIYDILPFNENDIEFINLLENKAYAYSKREYGVYKYGYENTLRKNMKILDSGGICLDFDTAIGGQDFDPVELIRTIKFTTHLHDEKTASVTVDLKNFEEPWKVHWFLTKEDGLWYVYDKEIVNMGILFSEYCN